MKSHYCGEITSSNLKEKVTICGWIHRRRDHGGVIFLDVRDIKGICQAVVNPDNKESFELAESIRNEFVVQIEGVVRNRLEGTINKNMQTGEIEIEVANINILSKANTPVFPIDEYQEVNEDVRLKNKKIVYKKILIVLFITFLVSCLSNKDILVVGHPRRHFIKTVFPGPL